MGFCISKDIDANKAKQKTGGLTYEAGHAAGLNHSSVNNAVMYESVAVNTAKIELDLDDHSA